MNKIHTKEQFEEVLKEKGIHMFLFSAPWCADCVYIKPFMSALEKKFSGSMDFYELDRDECLDLAIELGIMGIPSFIAYKDGKQISSFISSLRKTKEEIEAYFEETLEEGGK